MEILTFPMLVTQLNKHSEELTATGYRFNYQSHENLYHDVLTISLTNNGKPYFFSIVHYDWLIFNEFSIYTNMSEKYFFRLNPINGEPFAVKNNSNIWNNQSQTMPTDFIQFGEKVLSVISEIYDKINRDRYQLMST